MTKVGNSSQRQDVKIDLKEFVENFPVGMYQVDNDGKFVYCNNTMAEILGYSNSKELIGKEIKDFYFNPEDRDRLMKKMREEGGKFLDETLHWKTRQNKEIYLSDSCQFLHDDNGKKIGVRGMVMKVWYRKVFDEMNEGIYKVGSDEKTIVKANYAVARMFGYQYPEEVEGLDITQFYKDAKDLDKFKADLYKYEKVKNYPVEMVTKDKEEIVVSVNASVVKDEKKNIIGREGTFRDITENYKIRKILEDMPTMAYQVKNENGKNRISYCNKAFAKKFGYSRPEEVIGIEVRKLYADKSDVNHFERALRDADEKDESLLDYRLRVKKKTGERFLVEIDSQLLKDHIGNIFGRQGTLRDATIKVQLEEILRRREDIQRFSHRFMAPIMSIKSSSDTLIKELKQSLKGEPLDDKRKVLKGMHGDPFSLLKQIKSLSKELFVEIKNSDALHKEEKRFTSQLNRLSNNLREYANDMRIDVIIELRETHRSIRICLFEYLFSKPNIQEDINPILEYLEVLDKLYILYIVQTITNTSKIAYTEVENLRSYLSGWEHDKKTKEKPFEYRKRNLYECINEVVNIYQIYAFEKGISIEIVSIDPTIEIQMSEEHFKIMLHNLIQNAVKYSYFNRKNIRIRVENMIREIKIETSNLGVGILPDEIQQGKIFDTGYRGKLSLDWNRTGSGIGLSEALKIAKKHGGDITISSRPVGSREDKKIKIPYITKVTITLPKFHN
jgi:PAS domain S-box-containing protein